MEILLAGVIGAVVAVPGAFVQAVFQITQKRLRNNRYIRRGEPPVKDVMFNPLFAPFAIAGAIGGLIAGAIGDGWIWGFAGGLALPAVASVGWIAGSVATLRR